jgi:thioredoxin reductase
VLLAVVLGLGLTLLLASARQAELRQMHTAVEQQVEVVRNIRGNDLLQHPVVDLSRCLGCGTCVEVCPEDQVLALVHGQAVVVNPARCVGVAACERACPVGAITVTVANLETRDDVPVLTEKLESVSQPGLFLAGEVTAHALIKTAIEHGTAVATTVAERIAALPPDDGELLDLCIVGSGPAGLACALQAKRLGLRALVLEQEAAIGGTVAKYPRRKLVLTQPVDLPLHGRLRRTSYSKEELMDLWQRIVDDQQLAVATGEVLEDIDRDAQDHHFVVRTQCGAHAARFVCLAIGRRGTPRKLGVPGEDLPKVAYSLLDAHSFQGRRILVVGGGDSAVETALGLAEQPGNQVSISYRREQFFRIRARNQQRLEQALASNRLQALLASEVRAIHPQHIDLATSDHGGPARLMELPNDDVFIMAGVDLRLRAYLQCEKRAQDRALKACAEVFFRMCNTKRQSQWAMQEGSVPCGVGALDCPFPVAG